MAYEKDYRKRILNFYYENGKTKTLFQFNISSSTLYGWIKLKKETGDLSSRTRKRKFKVLNPEKLDEYMKNPENADKYICEIAKDFGCGKETVRVALKKLGYTRKKTDKIQAAGHFLLFLPLYSLNLNPIENIKKTPKIFIILSVLYYL